MEEIPDEFYVREHYYSLTTSYDVKAKNQKLGTIYRRFLSFLLTYDFYDSFGNQSAYARSRFFSWKAHFDIFDMESRPIGVVEEKFTFFFPTFDIYGRDGYSKKAHAEMNFWGTHFEIYDVVTGEIIVEMKRPFFRLKNDWIITIKNRELFNARDIDPRLLMIVLAIQCDIEKWQRENRERDNNKQGDSNYMKLQSVSENKATEPDLMAKEINEIEEKITQIIKNQGIYTQPMLDNKGLEVLSNRLQAEFDKTQTINNAIETNVEKVNDFAEFCLNKAESSATSSSEKAGILFLLKTHLDSR